MIVDRKKPPKTKTYRSHNINSKTKLNLLQNSLIVNRKKGTEMNINIKQNKKKNVEKLGLNFPN